MPLSQAMVVCWNIDTARKFIDFVTVLLADIPRYVNWGSGCNPYKTNKYFSLAEIVRYYILSYLLEDFVLESFA